MKSKIYRLMLLFIPLSIYCKWRYGANIYSFVCACLGIIPLAKFMGEATENLSNHVGEVIGGLLNASFGNACELIIAITALKSGFYEVVKASLTGSIISNVLLVLGASMFFGGFNRQHQRFNKVAAMTSATLLALASISLIIPTVFHYIYFASSNNLKVLHESRLALFISVILFSTYLASLFFTLKTHKNLFTGSSETDPQKVSEIGGNDWSDLGVTAAVADTSITNLSLEQSLSVGSGAINVETKQSFKTAMFILVIATILVTVLSDILVASLEPFAKSLGLSQTFIGVILIAIIGNAAEHSTAVYFAMKNKIDLSINIALGSGSQIALFVAPIIVFASFIIGKPMNLCFSYFEVLSIAVSVIILSFVAVDGECNWLEGFQLLALYLILACTFYFL